jgi:hypothetical protein
MWKITTASIISLFFYDIYLLPMLIRKMLLNGDDSGTQKQLITYYKKKL